MNAAGGEVAMAADGDVAVAAGGVHTASRLSRRARSALGTLVDVGACGGIERAFGLLSEIEFELSRFNPAGDVGLFNALPAGQSLRIGPHTLAVLEAALALSNDSRGLFDVAQGTGRWSLKGRELRKEGSSTRIDLGGIGKGYAVDRCFESLGKGPAWVNAGGDLRVRGVEVPVLLRDESAGGVRPWMLLREGALATSWFGPGAGSVLAGRVRAPHVSVAAPSCMLADALTKVVALTGQADHPLLARHGATAWLHGEAAPSPSADG